MRSILCPHWRPALLFGAAGAVAACAEVAPIDRPKEASARRGVEAELIVSDLAPRPGADVVVLVRVRMGADVRPVASFTARVSYDTTRLRLQGEEGLGDEATRIINPAPGETRVAGIALNGFVDGPLFALHFTALRHDALAGVQVAFDELHSVDRTDLQKVVQIAPTLYPRALK